MPVEPLSEPTSKGQYSLYEMVNKSRQLLAEFETLTGGEQTIATISYKIMDENGNVITRSMPGHISFTPVSLLRAMDKGAKEAYDKFVDAASGKLKKVRRNYSVSMNDSKGKAVVWWHLYNAIPIKISGFDFNMRTEHNYTDFTIDIQPEYIEIVFP